MTRGLLRHMLLTSRFNGSASSCGPLFPSSTPLPTAAGAAKPSISQQLYMEPLNCLARLLGADHLKLPFVAPGGLLFSDQRPSSSFDPPTPSFSPAPHCLFALFLFFFTLSHPLSTRQHASLHRHRRRGFCPPPRRRRQTLPSSVGSHLVSTPHD